jgi:hypothetical protein
MTTPVVEASQQTARTANETTSLINMPATVSVGALLIIWGRINQAGAFTMPGGWTALFPDDSSDASDDVTVCYYKTADGSEGGTTISVTHGSGKSSYVSASITGADPVPLVSTLAIGSSTTPDPPSFTPSPGAQDYLWLWCGLWEGAQTNPPTTPPTGYTIVNNGGTGTASTAATNSRTTIYRKASTAATTENPASVTISVTGNWTAFTMAIPPPLSGAPATSFIPVVVGG